MIVDRSHFSNVPRPARGHKHSAWQVNRFGGTAGLASRGVVLAPTAQFIPAAHEEAIVARISVKSDDARSRVTVSGPLQARDLRRLERACGPALEKKQMALELRLRGVEQMDAAARAFLNRLVDRGASIVQLPSSSQP